MTERFRSSVRGALARFLVKIGLIPNIVIRGSEVKSISATETGIEVKYRPGFAPRVQVTGNTIHL